MEEVGPEQSSEGEESFRNGRKATRQGGCTLTKAERRK